jgi:hypothetical protein
MYHISEPITKWDIVITEVALPEAPGEPQRIFGTAKFKTLAQLRDYLFIDSKYNIGKSLGYTLKEPDPKTYSKMLIGRLGFEYTDRFLTVHFEFKSVGDFVRYLEKQPLAASVVGYVKK